MEKELYNLKVVRVDEMAKTYIVEYEDKLYRVHMVPEQLGKEKPEEIVCTIEKSKNTNIITQDMETLLRRHYKEGDEVMYKIEKVTNSYYFLKDEFGYNTYLDSKYKINPTITPQLRCRIKSINNKRVYVELIEKITLERSQFTIGSDNVKALFQKHIDCYESITDLLLSDKVLGSFDSECHKWIHSIRQNNNADKEYLSSIKHACLSVLEESSLLNDCNSNERQVLEERFSTLIEQIGYYIHALNYVEQETDEQTIDQLLEKLQNTGYVFHPKKNFYIMMCIFLIKSKDDDGQEFLDNMMPKIFDTLRSCDIANWQREPFKLVWIKLLEFFIQTLNQNQDKLLTDKTSLANMVQSLSLQFNLTEEDDEVLLDSILNLSMLYRYCARVGVINPMLMLNVAYHTLIGAIQEQPCMITNTSDADRVANIICNQVGKFTPSTTTSLRYEGKNADILLDNTSVKIVPKEYNPEETYGMVPEHLELWNNLQVEQHTKPSPIAKANRKTIKPYKSLWKNIEREILCPEDKNKKKTDVHQAQVGDQFGIIVTRQTADETPTFECKVVDPDDVDIKGTIRMADMVGYATPTVGLFSFEKNGKPMIFDGFIKEKNPDGTYIFESKQFIENFGEDYRYAKIKYTDSVFCVVSGGNTLQPFTAISEQGIPILVRYSEEQTPVQMPKGSVIEVTCIESGKSGFMNATLSRMAPEKQLTLADAFHSLLCLISGGDVYEAGEAEADETDTPDIIDRSRIRELMSIIDNVASLDNDYIKAYNYLGFSKMIAHIVEDEQQAQYYDSKMSLIELLYEFDINDSISEELITKFQSNNGEFFTKYSTLHYQFRKLQIVSYLGHEEHNRELCDIACDTSNPDLAQLAQLIISYNFMEKTNMVAQAQEVQEHIKELLKLQKKDNPKKDYGQETFTQEFKTSIICPPDTMRPDPTRQTHKIMQEICAFLNAEGGTLYIGVDDQTHLERGIEEDLKHPLFTGNKDKYDTYVRNKINQMLSPGELADHHIKTSFDESAHTPVYVIEIQRCPTPISLDGVFYERRGTSSRHVSDEYLNTFISNRLQLASSIQQEQINEIIENSKPADSQEEAGTDEDKMGKPLDYSTDLNSIKTSEIRKHRHSKDDLQSDELPVYVNIFQDNTYSISDQQLFDCLSLGIYDEEQNGVLIVVYDTGEMSKIPMDELLETEMWVHKTINNKSRIIFVSPAQPTDVLSVKYHSKNSDYYRFITVDTIDRGTFNTCMRPFYNGPIDEIQQCEILQLPSRSPYRNFLDIDNDKPGADTTKTDGKKAAQAISNLLK